MMVSDIGFTPQLHNNNIQGSTRIYNQVSMEKCVIAKVETATCQFVSQPYNFENYCYVDFQLLQPANIMH